MGDSDAQIVSDGPGGHAYRFLHWADDDPHAQDFKDRGVIDRWQITTYPNGRDYRMYVTSTVDSDLDRTWALVLCQICPATLAILRKSGLPTEFATEVFLVATLQVGSDTSARLVGRALAARVAQNLVVMPPEPPSSYTRSWTGHIATAIPWAMERAAEGSPHTERAYETAV